jgi:hypothetical protein
MLRPEKLVAEALGLARCVFVNYLLNAVGEVEHVDIIVSADMTVNKNNPANIGRFSYPGEQSHLPQGKNQIWALLTAFIAGRLKIE